jgi:hypothetical protein
LLQRGFPKTEFVLLFRPSPFTVKSQLRESDKKVRSKLQGGTVRTVEYPRKQLSVHSLRASCRMQLHRISLLTLGLTFHFENNEQGRTDYV